MGRLSQSAQGVNIQVVWPGIYRVLLGGRMDSARKFLQKIPEVVRPTRLFLVFLTVTFAVEYGLMFLLPLLVPRVETGLVAFLDASVLTLVLAPLVWFGFLVPLIQHGRIRSRLLGWILAAQEGERGRIARDLHDGLGQSLTSLLIGLKWIEETAQSESVRERAKNLRGQTSQTLDGVRQLVRGLRPTVLDDVGLEAALQKLVRDQLHTNRVEVDLVVDMGKGNWSGDMETAVYRLVQEALTNALKHSGASRVAIRVGTQSENALVEVVDNGVGFDAKKALRGDVGEGPFGLWSMRERVELLGGEFRMESSPGNGCRIQARVPLEEKK